jgi:PKD repeat protein
LTVHAQEAGRSGESHSFSAEAASDSWPVLDCTWEFGDGVSADGMNANHTYTHPGTYEGKATSKGVDGLTFSKTFKVTISGTVETHFAPEEKRRPE